MIMRMMNGFSGKMSMMMSCFLAFIGVVICLWLRLAVIGWTF
jgi:hypothetical protein